MSPTAGTATGSCPVCGQPFTSTPRQRPRRRYCSERCRKTAWRHRHPGHRSRPGEILHASPARAEPAARCPHCARPVAVIALLVVPAAAQVPAPEVRDG